MCSMHKQFQSVPCSASTPSKYVVPILGKYFSGMSNSALEKATELPANAEYSCSATLDPFGVATSKYRLKFAPISCLHIILLDVSRAFRFCFCCASAGIIGRLVLICSLEMLPSFARCEQTCNLLVYCSIYLERVVLLCLLCD